MKYARLKAAAHTANQITSFTTPARNRWVPAVVARDCINAMRHPRDWKSWVSAGSVTDLGSSSNQNARGIKLHILQG